MKKLLQALVIGIVAAGVALFFSQGGYLDGLENATWAWRVRAMAHPSPSTPKIKLILVDQASLDWGASEQKWQWPWPREVYVPVLDFCARSGAKVVAFDMLYSEPSEISAAADAAFGDAIARNGKAVMAFFMGSQATQATNWPADVRKPSVAVEGLKAWLNPMRSAVISEPRATFPIPDVATNAAMLASVKELADPDGVFRRHSPFRIFDGQPVPQLGMAAYFQGGGGNSARLADRRLAIGGNSYPVDDLGRLTLRYRGKSGTHQAYSAAAIVQSELLIEEGSKPTIDTNALRDCYVFFGVSAPGLKDQRQTPVAGDYPGVEIHATLLDNLLENDFIRDMPWWAVVVGTIIPALVAALLIIFSRKVWQNVAVILVILPLPLIRGFVAYKLGFWWPVVGPEMAVSLSLISAVVLNYATEGRQKRFIKSAFNQYVGEEVLDELVRDPTKLKLGGEKRELTMFFSDLEKFSSFSERLDPPQLIELLNAYLTEMGHIIKQETGGFLDKYIGDAIVAFWNAPIAQPDHAARAVRAALLCQRKVAEKRAEWEQQFKSVLKMRIGIGTGEVVVGNMGSLDKFNYTMLGDAANASSRLEGANKAFGTYTMVSEVTWAQAKGAVLGRELGSIRVVGRKSAVRVFEPMALAGESLPGWVADFERGVALCREQKWKDALAVFEKISDDHASEVYAERCRSLISGALKEWDGVWNLTEK